MKNKIDFGNVLNFIFSLICFSGFVYLGYKTFDSGITLYFVIYPVAISIVIIGFFVLLHKFSTLRKIFSYFLGIFINILSGILILIGIMTHLYLIISMFISDTDPISHIKVDIYSKILLLLFYVFNFSVFMFGFKPLLEISITMFLDFLKDNFNIELPEVRKF